MNMQLLGLLLIPVIGVSLGRLVVLLINALDKEDAPDAVPSSLYKAFDAYKKNSRDSKEKIIEEVKRHLAY